MNFNSNQEDIPNTQFFNQYCALEKQFLETGITYKSNEIIHKICQQKLYPYPLLIKICKLFHLNHFEIIFMCHLLHDQQCLYREDPAIFLQQISLNDLVPTYNKMTNNGENIEPMFRVERLNSGKIEGEDDNQNGQLRLDEDEREEDANMEYWDWANVRQLYIYLFVIGYSVKYYLNQYVKPYQEQIRRKYPDFFSKVFNDWVDKYGNKVLRTNPKRINQFYSRTFVIEDNEVDPTVEVDCQYRNYNEIVEELIKATTQNEEVVFDTEKDL